MKMMFVAGVMITLPAIVLVVAFFGRMAMLPALASLSINFLPFLAAAWLLKKYGPGKGGDELGH